MSDNGFLKLDNSIIDYWMSRLNHSEFKTLLTIYRKTVGWNKQYDKISQNQISSLSGITTRSVRTAISSLEDLGLIITTGKNKSAKVFTLNTNKLFDVCLKSDDVIELESKLESISQSSEVITYSEEINSVDDVDNFLHKRHHKDTNKKQIKETSVNIPFFDFWTKYDYNKGQPKSVEAKWLSLSDEERTLVMASLDNYLLSTPDKTFRKFPMTYLNTEAWLEEVVISTPTVSNGSTYHSSPNSTYSASFKPFDTDTTELDSNPLESTTGAYSDVMNTDSTVTNINNQTVHWWDMKEKGLLKPKVNPNAVKLGTKTSKAIDDFFANFGSKRGDTARAVA